MKRTLLLTISLCLLIACENKATETKVNDTLSEDYSSDEDINQGEYSQYNIAYLIDGELYFHDIDNDERIKLEAETERIHNHAFDKKGKTLFYSVIRDKSLWLKSLDLITSEAKPEWLVNLNINKDDIITETYAQISPLYYKDEKLLIRHHFSWDYYDFSKYIVYSIKNNEIFKGDEENNDEMQKFFPYERNEQIITENEHIYYNSGEKKICLSDKLNLKSETEAVELFDSQLSPDKTKITFGAILEWGDLPHGPYCIANLDGSKQMILDGTDVATREEPVWLKNNTVVFIRRGKLAIANNDNGFVKEIADKVDLFVVK